MKRRIIIVSVIFTILTAVLIIFKCCNNRMTDNTQPKHTIDNSAVDITDDSKTVAGTKTIEIPGYDSITFSAEQLKQKAPFKNPKDNKCYFVISLYLPNGTLIYQSGLIEPGKAIYDIALSQAVEAGTYQNSVLQYSCYQMDGTQKQLNGARTHLTLIFK